ncbi:DNA polymerase-like protein [Tanacetum coccineum]
MKLLDGSWFMRISYADGLSTIIPYSLIRSDSGQEQAVYYRSYSALRRIIRRSRRCASSSTLQQPSSDTTSFPQQCKVKLFLFRFLEFTPWSLHNLAMSLCPDHGGKSSVDHESVNEKSLEKEKRFYNDEIFPIHIPNQNEDTFIRKLNRRSYDSYRAIWEKLYYYDVNSLYPFVMKEYPMPCGKPVWYSNLEDMDIDSMLGFIEAYVVSVNYSEELKYAVGLGYKVVPISGYLFERKESPFKDFVRSLFLNSGLTLKAQSQRCAISKDTDTDSVVLSQSFPEELISSSISGMLKLEDQIEGFFLAPKAYSYYIWEGSTGALGEKSENSKFSPNRIAPDTVIG